jgi:carboxymethylenebutenolidase
MGETISLKSRHDGFEFSAYRAKPTDARRGGLVVMQEIFGVTADMREACDAFAADGYEAIAPSVFDRVQPGFLAEVNEAGYAAGRAASAASPIDQVMGDVQATIDALTGPVFYVGYCFGGFMGWMAASRCQGLTAVSGYYGRRIAEHLADKPLCPIILHFGKHDPHIPMSEVEPISEAYPDIPVYLYEAGHGFCRRSSKDYDAESDRLSRLRTLQLFHRSGGAKGEMGG